MITTKQMKKWRDEYEVPFETIKTIIKNEEIVFQVERANSIEDIKACLLKMLPTFENYQHLYYEIQEAVRSPDYEI